MELEVYMYFNTGNIYYIELGADVCMLIHTGNI